MATVLTIIPAKGNSSRLPGKNKRLLAGKPLVQYAIEQAKEANICGEICVGTDDEKIEAIARQAGASVPFRRTEDVDSVTPVGVAAYNIQQHYKKELGQTFEYICLLLTTSPLRSAGDIRMCGELLMRNPEYDASMTFCEMHGHPYWAWDISKTGEARTLFPEHCHKLRGEVSPAYLCNGAVYWARTKFFEETQGDQYKGRVLGLAMPAERSVDIDAPLDFRFAEFLLKEKSC